MKNKPGSSVVEMLRKMGHEVVEASSPDDIERLLKEGDIDLVIVGSNDKNYGVNPGDRESLQLLLGKRPGLVC